MAEDLGLISSYHSVSVNIKHCFEHIGQCLDSILFLRSSLLFLISLPIILASTSSSFLWLFVILCQVNNSEALLEYTI